MLVDGELDAVSAHANCRALLIAHRTWVDVPELSGSRKEYYKRSGMFPIMHLMESEGPWLSNIRGLPATIYKASAKAKRSPSMK